MRPASAPSSASMRVASRRSVAASSGSSMASSQATKRDMCVPFCSAGSATSSDQSATVGTTAPSIRSWIG